MLDTLAAPVSNCRISIAIPAKDEAESIESALAAFVDQAALDGTRLDPARFEVLVFANDCGDDTAQIGRAFAAKHPGFAFHVFSGSLPRGAAHVGSARRIVLDIALDRQRAVNGDGGAIASTDADSVVDRFWVARVLDELDRVDAVAGHVEIARAERDAMPAPFRRLYELELSYRRLLGAVEARFDPRPFDPPSRHDSLVGANFAVRCATYVAAGRLPTVSCLEDVAFARALRRIDARIRHSYDARVETSGRTLGRVVGGFGTYIEHLTLRGSRRESYRVDSAARSILRAKTRGSLRAFWTNGGDVEALEAAANLYEVSASELAGLVDFSAPFGETLDRIDGMGVAFESLPEVPIEAAVAALRDATTAAIAPSATRMSAASGAG